MEKQAEWKIGREKIKKPLGRESYRYDKLAATQLRALNTRCVYCLLKSGQLEERHLKGGEGDLRL